MRFGSVCSGIEAASVAWHPLGWKAAWLSEIEPFPCAVLAHHYPDVPNLGDMTALPDRILSGEVEAPDLFCGGTPCQAFSVAGLRNSLDDARGNLSLTFVGIANAIDHVRVAGGSKPAIIFWENVPGVLSTKDNAFGCFLAGLAGEDNPLEPPRGKWTNAGYVLGPKRAVAWRVLDAQYFGVAQRRRRVFVVASARDDFDPAAVLFEFDGLRRDSAPSREAGKEVARRAGAGASFGGMSPVAGTLTANTGGMTRPAGNANELDFCVPVGVEIGPSGGKFTDLNPTLDTRAKDGPIRNQLAGAVITMAHGQGGAEIGFDRGPTLTCNHEAPIAAYPATTQFGDTAETLTARHDSSPCADRWMNVVAQPISYGIRTANTSSNGWGIQEEVTHTLDTTQGVAVAQPIGIFQDSEFGVAQYDSAGTLRAGRIPEHQMVMQPVAFHPTQDPISSTDGTTHGLGCGSSGGQASVAVAQPIGLDEEQNAMVDAFGTLKARSAGGGFEGSVMQANMQVRRLTPMECERLQGFGDSYTQIPWRNKPASECPDGPRYKALGNSWAVPNVRWIGKRIQEALNALP